MTNDLYRAHRRRKNGTMCDQAAKFSTASPLRCVTPTPRPFSRGHLASALNSDPTPNAWLRLRQPPQGPKDFDFLSVTSCPLWFNISLAKSLLSNILPVTPFDARICRLSAGSICGKYNRINYMHESIPKKICYDPALIPKARLSSTAELFVYNSPSIASSFTGETRGTVDGCVSAAQRRKNVAHGASRGFSRHHPRAPKGRKNT